VEGSKSDEAERKGAKTLYVPPVKKKERAAEKRADKGPGTMERLKSVPLRRSPSSQGTYKKEDAGRDPQTGEHQLNEARGHEALRPTRARLHQTAHHRKRKGGSWRDAIIRAANGNMGKAKGGRFPGLSV